MKTRNMLFIFIIGALLISACTAESRETEGKGESRTITVSGQGVVVLTPDISYISIGVQSQSAEAAEALSKNNQDVKAIMDTLQSNAIDPVDITTSNFNVYPQQDWGPNGERGDISYIVNNTVYVTLHDLSKIGQILDAVVRVGANSIGGIQFDVEDRKTPSNKALDLAIQDAKTRAEVIATSSGIELGKIMTIMPSVSGVPSPYAEKALYGMGGGGGDVPISTGQLNVTVDVTIVYEIK